MPQSCCFQACGRVANVIQLGNDVEASREVSGIDAGEHVLCIRRSVQRCKWMPIPHVLTCYRSPVFSGFVCVSLKVEVGLTLITLMCDSAQMCNVGV